MIKMTEHPVAVQQLPLPATLEPLRIEELVIAYQHSWTLDLGALCYLRRSKARRKPGRGRYVDMTSFCETRAKQIREFARAASDYFSMSGLRVSTIFNIHSGLARLLDWADEVGQNDILSSTETAREALRIYSNFLSERIDQGKLGLNTACDYQKNLFTVFETHFGFEKVRMGLKAFVGSGQLGQRTAVPEEDAQAMVLSWCTCLFWGLSELALDNKPFPYALSVPSYLQWPSDQIWVFPLRRWCETPMNLNSSQKYMAYDFRNGLVRNSTQISAQFGPIKFPATKLIARATERLEIANSDPRDYARGGRAALAVQAFFLLYIANTGMNLTQALEMPWCEDLELAIHDPLVERQGFRTIKYRANNRVVSFEIGIQFLPALRRYLQLRAYLLDGAASRLLFHFQPTLTDENYESRAGRGKEQVQFLFRTLRRLCPDLPRILPMQWRAAMQDYAIRHYDPLTAAAAMQHSPETAIKIYSNGSQTLQQKEVRSFLTKLERVAILRDGAGVGMKDRPLGSCASPDEPVAITSSAPISPDCNVAEGCLFCDKYRVHADLLDVKKLLSARIYIKKVGSCANDYEHFQRFFGTTLCRIEEILVELRQQNAQIVELATREIEIAGELDGYWAAKMDLLMELELA